MPEHCHECGSEMNGNTCECGWVSANIDDKTPASIDDELTRILSTWAIAKKRWPDGMPVAPRDAANWWPKIMKPNAKAGMLVFCLRRFLTETSRLQRLVIAASEDHIYWRGESFDNFVKIINETERMRDIGVEPYRAETRKFARDSLKRLRHRNV